MHINLQDIATMPVTTRTGREFGNLIISTMWLKDGRIVDVLFDSSEEVVASHPKVEALSQFFNKRFHPATLIGQPALIHQVI
jgi:hypothetical protein